ncbi:hypothetical protein BC826DRAFT_122067 [Russula brevipes]|nr:hypothetical protein BC826DRAFT_122067 [Russula brevipes]
MQRSLFRVYTGHVVVNSHRKPKDINARGSARCSRAGRGSPRCVLHGTARVPQCPPPFALHWLRGARRRSHCVGSAALAAVCVALAAQCSPPFALHWLRVAAVRVVLAARRSPPFALHWQRSARRRSREGIANRRSVKTDGRRRGPGRLEEARSRRTWAPAVWGTIPSPTRI